ncbi:phasin family protein [Oricola sp.]|uniref:phasin family protein n=1 Tax=Oricola sp. TaxID=1979950 RepID=UPI003BAAFE5F
MAKAAAPKTETADVFAFPAMDAAPFADQFRSFAEQGIAKSKETFEQVRASMEDAQKSVETAVETAQGQNSKVTLTAIGMMRTNVEAGFSHLEKLVGVKTFAEAVELQSAFLRKQTELAVDQAKEFQTVSRDALEALSAPVKEAADKAAASIKAA